MGFTNPHRVLMAASLAGGSAASGHVQQHTLSDCGGCCKGQMYCMRVCAYVCASLCVVSVCVWFARMCGHMCASKWLGVPVSWEGR